ncbi:hypothetical protein VDGL01_03937 [Verticillium dahliae]
MGDSSGGQTDIRPPTRLQVSPMIPVARAKIETPKPTCAVPVAPPARTGQNAPAARPFDTTCHATMMHGRTSASPLFGGGAIGFNTLHLIAVLVSGRTGGFLRGASLGGHTQLIVARVSPPAGYPLLDLIESNSAIRLTTCTGTSPVCTTFGAPPPPAVSLISRLGTKAIRGCGGGKVREESPMSPSEQASNQGHTSPGSIPIRIMFSKAAGWRMWLGAGRNSNIPPSPTPDQPRCCSHRFEFVDASDSRGIKGPS